MAHFIRHLNRVFACVLCLTALHAEPSPVAKAVDVRFTVFALGGADGIAYRPMAGEMPRTLKFFSAYRSPPYDYRGGSRMCFFDPAGGSEAVPVAIYDVPEGVKRVLLLFFPRDVAGGSGLRYDVYGVDEGLERVPAGHFTTINVSGREYAGQYGANRIVIPQGVGAAHPGKARVALSLAAQVEGQWLAAGRHEFGVAAQERVTLIFYPPASRTSVYPLIRRLSEMTPASGGKTGEMAQAP